MNSINRGVEDVKKLIIHAKLTEDELLPVTQVLEFDPDLGQEGSDVVLLELDPKLLAVVQEEGSVMLRGDPEDGVVLCTKGKTYEVREAETSNSLVLVPDLIIPDKGETGDRCLRGCQVTCIKYNYLETKLCKPRLHKLRELLDERPYGGAQQDQEAEGRRYCLSELLEQVQCSEDELEGALHQLEAFHLYGFWQVLQLEYKFSVVTRILNLIKARSWPLDAVPRDAVVKELSQIEERAVVSQCFEYYLDSVGEDNTEGDALYTLKDDKICRLQGESLLKTAEKYNLQEFLRIWQLSVPEGLTINLSQLSGVALLDRSSTEQAVSYFPVSSLPKNTQERFDSLFALRDMWTFEEIRPYIEDLTGDRTTINTLLNKYTRASTVDGIKYYSGKHSK